MKIILEAFGQLSSDVMDIPESSGNYFTMSLTQSLTTISGFDDKKISEIPPLNTICEFEWTGKYYALNNSGEPFSSARIYVLRDIIKN